MLEEFAKLNSNNEGVRLQAGQGILSHVTRNTKELEYAVTRLVRGLESHKVFMRTGSYTTLAALLSLNKLGAVRLRELVGNILVTDQQTSKKERRLVYVARILASGAILRTLPLSSILLQEDLLKGILIDLVELGRKRSTLMELAAPFICHVLNDKSMTLEVFESIAWPCLLPLFCKSEVKIDVESEEAEEISKDINISNLHIALTCFEQGLKTDFKFLSDVDQLVRILLANRVTNIDQIAELVVSVVKKNNLAEEFWSSLVPQIRSSHFDTVCVCVQKSIKLGIPHNIVVREEIVTPLLGVFKNDEAPDQHSKAISTLDYLLKWSDSEESVMKKKKQRKSVMKILFAKSPNLLHEYKSLLRILKPFLAEVCKRKDLDVLFSIVGKQLNDENGVSVRMGLVYLQFLARIAQTKQTSAQTMVEICKKLLNVGFGVEKLIFTKSQRKLQKDKDVQESKEKEETVVKADDGVDEDDELLVKKCCLDSLHSVLASAYNPTFMEDIFAFIIQEIESFTADASIQKTIKKVEKLKSKTEDPHLRYILKAYAMQLLLDQDKVLGEAKVTMEEVIAMHKSASKNDVSTEIIQFILTNATKDIQPPFDYEAMFSRLVIEEKVSDAAIQIFAEAIDVDGQADDDGDDSEEDDNSSDDEQDQDAKMDVKNGVEEKEDELDRSKDEAMEEEPLRRRLRSNASKIIDKKADKDESDSDAMSSVDMDEATEEDLKNMDNALAKVFATKKKVKEEESSEIRSVMRTFRLLDTLLTRNSKLCHVSIPLMLLMPIVHSLQNSISRKKSEDLSTRIVTVLNKLNAIKKFEGVDSIESGSLLIMARDIYSALKNVKNKMIADLLGDSIILLTKCYLQRSEKTKTKGENVGFVTLYTGMMDLSNDKRNKSMGNVYNIICSALTILPNWKEGKEAICKKLFAIIFDPEVRMFRRLQFLVLLRAALGDKTHSSEESSFNQWKVKAMKDLEKHSIKYFSTCTIEMKSLTSELLSTFNDAKNDPLLSEIVNEFIEKTKDSSVILDNLNLIDEGKFKRLLSLLVGVSCENSDKKKIRKDKRKANGLVSEVDSEVPKKKKSKKAK